ADDVVKQFALTQTAARNRERGAGYRRAKDMPLDRSLISHLPAFAGLDGKDLDAILSQARSSRFPKDSEMFAQEEEASSFFLLLSGHIRVVRTSPEGHQVIA